MGSKSQSSDIKKKTSKNCRGPEKQVTATSSLFQQRNKTNVNRKWHIGIRENVRSFYGTLGYY